MRKEAGMCMHVNARHQPKACIQCIQCIWRKTYLQCKVIPILHRQCQRGHLQGRSAVAQVRECGNTLLDSCRFDLLVPALDSTHLAPSLPLHSRHLGLAYSLSPGWLNSQPVHDLDTLVRGCARADASLAVMALTHPGTFLAALDVAGLGLLLPLHRRALRAAISCCSTESSMSTVLIRMA